MPIRQTHKIYFTTELNAFWYFHKFRTAKNLFIYLSSFEWLALRSGMRVKFSIVIACGQRKSWLQQHCNKYNNFHFDLSQMPFTLFGRKKFRTYKWRFANIVLWLHSEMMWLLYHCQNQNENDLDLRLKKFRTQMLQTFYWSLGALSHSLSWFWKQCGVFPEWRTKAMNAFRVCTSAQGGKSHRSTNTNGVQMQTKMDFLIFAKKKLNSSSRLVFHVTINQIHLEFMRSFLFIPSPVCLSCSLSNWQDEMKTNWQLNWVKFHFDCTMEQIKM